MRLRVHADDFGVSRGVTDGILRCVDEGPVEGVSVIANGADFDHAIAALRARPRLAVSVHLNLVEGRPLMRAPELDLLVDAEGFLRHHFASLWRAYALATPATRRRLEAQVRAEFRAQAALVRAALGPDVPLRLDSHMHLHHIPFVCRIVTDLCVDLPAAGMRLVREPFLRGLPAESRPGLDDLARHVLLNRLGRRGRREAVARGIATEDWFVGALRTGRMSAAAVDIALSRIDAQSAAEGRQASVEILFHPGGAAPGEETVWTRYPWVRAYYYSPWRRRESEVLRGPELAACLRRWGVTTRPAAPPAGSTRGS